MEKFTYQVFIIIIIIVVVVIIIFSVVGISFGTAMAAYGEIHLSGFYYYYYYYCYYYYYYYFCGED